MALPTDLNRVISALAPRLERSTDEVVEVADNGAFGEDL